MGTRTNKCNEQLKNVCPVSVDIPQEDKDLASSIKGKLEEISTLKSIFRVPKKLLEENPTVYIPDIISIGPFHRHKNEEMEDHTASKKKEMENHKLHYLLTLLSRKPNLEASLQQCVRAVRESEKTAVRFYDGILDLPTPSDEFVEMMLVDGCFIIELFFKHALKGLRRRGDPIFSTPGLLSKVRSNLILLENQMPLLVLQRLYEVVPKPSHCDLSLGEFAFRFFQKMLPGNQEVLREKFSQEGNHLLDLIRQCYLPTYPREHSKATEFPKDLESATMLRKKYGIQFIKFTAKSLLDIKFSNGVIEIPPLTTHKFTEILFANMIALEQHQEFFQPFTSYALLMRAFVRCKKDVKLFRHLRIIIDDKNTQQKICELFERLCVEVSVKEFHYAGLVEQIQKYKARRLCKTAFSCCGLYSITE